jgi:protein gp37
MTDTKIQWTSATWNPTTGCDRVSPGCDNCYALTLAKRLKGMGQAKYQTDGDPRTSGPGFGVAMHEDALDAPLHWRRPRRVFVNSMSDLFHPRISDAFIADVWAVMARTPQHTYQVLTKRAPRMASLIPDEDRDGGHRIQAAATTEVGAQALYDAGWPLPNVHLGVSVEDQQRADERVWRLRGTLAAVRFLSCEPLLGSVNLDSLLDGGTRLDGDPQRSSALTEPCPTCGGWGVDCGIDDYHFTRRRDGLDWVIIGGESGPGARPMDLDWARSLVEQCRRAGVAVFVKQLGSRWGKSHHDIDTWPADLQVREWPKSEASAAASARLEPSAHALRPVGTDLRILRSRP